MYRKPLKQISYKEESSEEEEEDDELSESLSSLSIRNPRGLVETRNGIVQSGFRPKWVDVGELHINEEPFISETVKVVRTADKFVQYFPTNKGLKYRVTSRKVDIVADILNPVLENLTIEFAEHPEYNDANITASIDAYITTNLFKMSAEDKAKLLHKASVIFRRLGKKLQRLESNINDMMKKLTGTNASVRLHARLQEFQASSAEELEELRLEGQALQMFAEYYLEKLAPKNRAISCIVQAYSR